MNDNSLEPRCRAGIILGIPALISALVAGETRSMEATADPAIRKIRQAAAKIEPLHEKKRPPSPHDWLAQHEESGQSFDEYLKSNPNRPTATRTKLYVQPLGAFNDRQRRLVEETAELMSLFYNLPVEMLDPIGLDLIPP